MRTLPVLLAGTRTLPDLATFNAATLDRIAANGDLYITGAALPRDLLSESRSLAAARLRTTLVAAPTELVDPARDAYRTLLQRPLGDTPVHPGETPQPRRQRPIRPAHQCRPRSVNLGELTDCVKRCRARPTRSTN